VIIGKWIPLTAYITLKTHHIVLVINRYYTIAEEHGPNIDFNQDEVKKRSIKCFNHRQETLSLFCETCDCLVCTSCILDNHNMHQLCKITNVAEKKQQELRALLNFPLIIV